MTRWVEKSVTRSNKTGQMSEPWIGREYDTTHLLLLGESAYSWMEGEEVRHPSPRHAIELVEEVLRGKQSGRFMTMLSRGLARRGKPQPGAPSIRLEPSCLHKLHSGKHWDWSSRSKDVADVAGGEGCVPQLACSIGTKSNCCPWYYNVEHDASEQYPLY
jgi:hypothetical protein